MPKKSDDRLEQIWQNFSASSSFDLTGVSLASVPRPASPSRAESNAAPLFAAPLRASDLPSGATDPVGAALTSMRTAMQAAPARRASTPPASMPAAPVALPASTVEARLFADLSFTRSKTTRRDGDYITYAAGRQLDWEKRKRRRFLGIF